MACSSTWPLKVKTNWKIMMVCRRTDASSFSEQDVVKQVNLMKDRWQEAELCLEWGSVWQNKVNNVKLFMQPADLVCRRKSKGLPSFPAVRLLCGNRSQNSSFEPLMACRFSPWKTKTNMVLDVLSGCCLAFACCCCWRPQLWATWTKCRWTATGKSGRPHTRENTTAWWVPASVWWTCEVKQGKVRTKKDGEAE